MTAGAILPRDSLHLEQHTVDACPNDQRIALGLEVNVAGAVFGGGEDDRVDEADERRVGDAVVGLELVFRISHDLDCVEIHAAATAHRIARALEALDLLVDVVDRGDRELELMARREPQLIDRVNVRRVGERHPQDVAVDRVRHRRDPLQDVQRDRSRRLG